MSGSAPREISRVLGFGSERAIGSILSAFRRGAHDATCRVEGRGAGRWWLAWPTPEGPVTARFEQQGDRRVEVVAWGSGASWLLEQAEPLLGGGDDISGFVPEHPLLAQLWSRFQGWRVPASGLVTASLIPTIIEQKVTGQEAFGAQRRLIRRFGVPAPGPGRDLGLIVAPDARDWARIPSWEWLRAGVDAGRSDTIMRALVSPGRLEECARLPLPDAHGRLRSIPGVGVWTAAEVAQRALGDADAVSFGDYHVAKNIGWALVGEELDDDGLAELLAPYAGHRYRVQRLIELAGLMRPRKGARLAPRTHLPR